MHTSKERLAGRTLLSFLQEEETCKEEEELRRIFNCVASEASEAIVLTEAELDPPGPKILWVNQAFSEITGYEREEVIGETPRLLQGPETDEDEIEHLRTSLAAGERFEGETINYRKDGTPYVNHWSIAPIQKDNGAIAYWVSVQRDVTEKRRLEEEVLRTLDEERSRIGRDLHDSVGSLVTAANMRLENFIYRSDLDSTEEEGLNEVRSTIQETYESLRRISQGLSPVDLVDGSVVQGLRRLAAVTPNGEFESDEALDEVLSALSEDDQVNLYWIVYEAVTNAERHANADTIHIRGCVETEGTAARVVVEDDGVGFDRSAAEEDAWGLRLMRYRADLLDAELTVESSSGEGTRVECRIQI